jgi:hypothetical protein
MEIGAIFQSFWSAGFNSYCFVGYGGSLKFRYLLLLDNSNAILIQIFSAYFVVR